METQNVIDCVGQLKNGLLLDIYFRKCQAFHPKCHVKYEVNLFLCGSIKYLLTKFWKIPNHSSVFFLHSCLWFYNMSTELR